MRNLFKIAALAALTIACVSAGRAQTAPNSGKKADKPLFRDPVYDGAADPIVRWNHAEKRWFMFYTNRRANIETTNGVDWVHGTPIGIAESTDGGATWTYRGQAKINSGENDYIFWEEDMVFIINYGKPDITFWAPDIVYHDGLYHMYLTVVPGTFDTWGYPRNIVHLTSNDMLEWNPEGIIRLANNKVIDAGVIRKSDGKWLMLYNNEIDGKSIYYAESDDLYTWTDKGKLAGVARGEGPMAFKWNGKYFMIVDEWQGFGVYSSDDLVNWTRQPRRILETPGTGPDDEVMGNHADVVVSGGKAYIFYFTHPGRKKSDGGGAAGNGGNGYEFRRSSIQVAELEYENGEITCDRDKPVYINLSGR